ncbi:hypothetical protein ACFX13_034725 [Malus domestica]
MERNLVWGGIPPRIPSMHPRDNVVTLKGSGDADEAIPIVMTQAIERSSGRGRRRKVEEPDTQGRKEKKGKGVAIGRGKGGPHGSSIAEVMQAVGALPGVETGSELWFFTTQLFLSEGKREMFAYMKDPDIKLQWLNYEYAAK